MQALFERLVFEVASYRHLTDDYVHVQPVGWLFSQFRSVQRAQWQLWTGQIVATEVALSRSLAVAFSGKKKPNLPPLPTWDDVNEKATRRQESDFVNKFQRANIKRQEQVGAEVEDAG